MSTKNNLFVKTPLIVTSIILLLFLNDTNAASTMAPNFPVYDVNGTRNLFYGLIEKLPEGGKMILNFTSVYCKPCKKEIPELLEISAQNKKTRLICVYSETGDLVKKSASDLGVIEKAYVDPFGIIKSKFNIVKIPVTLIINKKYEILGRFEGYTDKNIKQIKHLIN